MMSPESLSRLISAWVTISAMTIFLIHSTAQGHPLSPAAKRFGEFGAEGIEIENIDIFPPYRVKEFSKKPSRWEHPVPVTFKPKPAASYEIHFSQPVPVPASSSSQAVVFNEDAISIYDDYSENINRKPNEESDKENVINFVPEGSKSQNSSDTDDTNYTQRFFSNAVTSKDCPKGHHYSKIQKRCMRKYSSYHSSVIG